MYMIDRKAAIDILEVAINDGWEFDYAKHRMIELSTQPEILRCNECIHKYYYSLNNKRIYCMKHGCCMYIDDYCSYRERGAYERTD